MHIEVMCQCLYTGRALSATEIKSAANLTYHIKEVPIPMAWHALRL